MAPEPEKKSRTHYNEADKQLIISLLQADAGMYDNVLLLGKLIPTEIIFMIGRVP